MKDFKMPVVFHKVQLSVTRLNYEKCFYCKELYVSAVVTEKAGFSHSFHQNTIVVRVVFHFFLVLFSFLSTQYKVPVLYCQNQSTSFLIHPYALVFPKLLKGLQIIVETEE